MARYLGFPYYLRVDLLCGDKESSVRAIQEAFLTGLSPIIILTFQEPIHPTRLKPQRLETMLNTAPLKDSVPCDSDLCQMGWYAPMPILNGSVVYRVKVVSNGQGKVVPDESFSMNINGFVHSTKRGDLEISFGLEMPVLEHMLTLGSPSRPLWAVVDHTPVIILPGIPRYKAVLMTATDFQDTKIIEVGIESCWAGSLNCPQVGEFSSMILEAISTESSLFIRQNQLVHRFVGNYSLLANKNVPSDLWDQVLRSKCVSRMVPVLVPANGREYLYIVGGGWQKGTLFKAEIYRDSHSFTTVTKQQENTTVHLEPRGMFYNPSSDSLFIWGNALFVSQDGGKSYLFFDGFPLDQMIKYFTLSFHGQFAFVTETEELWWGQEGVAELVRIYPSLGWQAFSSIEALKGHTYYYNNSLLTVFFDWDNQLQEVVYHVDHKGKGHVVKRRVPVAEILSYSEFTAAPLEVHHLSDFSAFSFPLICPFFWEHLEHLPQPEPFNRIQRYQTRPPLASISTGLHSTASLATYNGLLYHLLLLHSEYIMDIGNPVHNPTNRWWQNELQYEDYYFYMSSNSVSSSGFNVQMDGYVRSYLKSEIIFPDKVYLDRRSSYTFSIYLASGHVDHLAVEKKPRELSDIGFIWLSAVVSDYHYLYVSVTRKELFNRGAVIYKVTLSDRELYTGQALAGQRLMPFSLLLRVSNSDMKCYQSTDHSVALKGQYRLPIYIGCPPGNRLAFDITTTLEQCTRLNKRYFNCPEPDPGMPCFYYDDMFYPYFLIQDLVTGESKRFLGSYTFKVVGGGPFSQDNIRMYSPQEVLKYNTINYRYFGNFVYFGYFVLFKW
ncbi:cation channel sperm-associated auxiliary subunit gamma-like [Aplochiton taeniatus]